MTNVGAAVSPGDVMETTMLGPMIGEHMPLWRDGEGVSYWRVHQPEIVRGCAGIGRIARTPVGERRFREAGMLHLHPTGRFGTLFLAARFRDPQGGVSGDAVELTRVDESTAKAAVSEDARSAFARWFGEMALAATERGEVMVLETGGWQVPFAPYALTAVTRAPDGTWMSLLETSPVPFGVPVWSEQPQHGDNQTLAAPARRDTITVSGVLADLAVRSWDRHLLDLALTFGPGPSGPWRAEPSAPAPY
ncbi:hypothetical protein [Nocardia sp. NPDC047038]|uniref:hypothetical protein n=1 Tax=Nocardia sp. NPDC047038 TaxID=3154338 RepID=UPI0033C1E322